MVAEQALSVTVDDILFRSDDARFSVLRATDEQSANEIVIVGDLGTIARGETLALRGRFEDHATFGKRFRVASFTPVSPQTPLGIARYLGSGLVPGVGPALAERLVQRFGARTLEVITTQSARLREVSGIGPQRAQAIADAVRSRAHEADALAYLQGLGLGPRLAKRIHQRYGEDAVRALREDPYRMAEQVPGIGFRRADEIGQALGYGLDDPRRAAGAVLHLVGRAADEGHLYLPEQALLEEARALTIPEGSVAIAIDALGDRGLIVREDDRVYASPLHTAEISAARRLVRLANQRTPPAGLAAALNTHATQISDDQRRAVELSFQHGLLILTGGPGTGKTTTVRALVAAHRALGHRVLLCAPTGRAAKRLSEATSTDASTIHRLLEYSPRTRSFARGESDPLEADLILVDEASMLDVALGDQLLRALPDRAALVLVGDVEQLPPVAPGPLLRELQSSNICPIVRLSQVFRQAQRSAIVRAAHAIQAGAHPVATPPHAISDGDLFLIRARDADQIAERIIEALGRMQVTYGLDPKRDVQVLTPMRKGAAGTERLNERLQLALNQNATATEPGAAPRLLRGDKVMQLKNDYERDVFNGDVGEVVEVTSDAITVLMSGRTVRYARDAIDALSLAYASTIHKVQGSEFPAVIIALHATHSVLLSRALVYTALTRAKRLAVIIGDERSLARAIANTVERRTHTRLAVRLIEAAGMLR